MLDFLESFFMAAYIIIAEVVTRIYSLVSPKFRFLPTNQPYWLPPKKGTILITGATAGLGKESAKYLAKLGYHVLITARNEDKGKKVLEEIKSFSGNQNVELHLVDFASLSSVRSFAQKMRDRKIPIHVLMNNAGALNEPVSVTKDHLESNFQVNHAAPMLLTVLLLDNLKMASPPARIVTVASVGSYFGPIDVKDLSWKKSSLPLHPLRNYFKAKLCNVMFASELQRKLNKEGRPDIISVSLHPGMIASSFYEEIPSFLKAIVRSFFTDSFFGARTQIYLTLAAPEELKKGGFYVNCEPYTPAPQAKDASLQKKLWVETSKLIGLHS